MIGFNIAAQTRCFAQPIKKALHTAARLECDGVQIDARAELTPAELSDTGLRQVRKMLADLNLRVGSVAFPTRRGYASAIDLQPRLEATMAAMQLASQLGSRILIGNLGPLSADKTASEWSTAVEAIEALTAHGDRLGVRMVLQTATAPALLNEFLDNFPEGVVAVDLHPGRLIAQGESPADFVAELGRHIAHVHAADGVRDLAVGQGVEVELGRGTADFPELMGMLEEFGYRGWLTIERRSSTQPIEDIGNAVRYLRAL